MINNISIAENNTCLKLLFCIHIKILLKQGGGGEGGDEEHRGEMAQIHFLNEFKIYILLARKIVI
jgi:hypothetical protein